ncbi:RabGAP/TBC [Lichtheimia hyalospora FSU 10163]|nr:RabGAP/TBC [Lichtheimia hyalospora FSU 10163]
MTNDNASIRREWDTIFGNSRSSLALLKQQAVSDSSCQSGLRSVYWKVFLEYFATPQPATWSSAQTERRQRYSNLKRKYIEEPAEQMIKKSDDDLDLVANNPLAQTDNNPWQQYFEDSEIRKVIRQDVDRTFPDVEFFRSDQVQEQMTDILFIYCKLNQDVSYRQGMHELLAPIYFVLSKESISTPNDTHSPVDATDRLITQVLDPHYVEHDAYILFDKLMVHAKPWYEFNEKLSSIPRPSGHALGGNIPRQAQNTRSNPVVLSCQRIHHQYLRAVDPVLYGHLERFGIEPQLYGMRWLRLLFGREFEFHELLRLWDAIFATDPSLKIAEYVCLAMLLRLRDKYPYLLPVLSSDYAECLTLLMRCPQVGNPSTLVEQASYLQTDLSEGGGLHILQQNDVRSGKPARHSLWDGIQQQQQRDDSMNRLQHRRSHGANLDGLASITRGVMKSPQVRDLNKAIAGVMGTVQKNVNMIGDNMLNRAASFDAPPSRRRLTVSSEFPANIDQQFARPSSQRLSNPRRMPNTVHPPPPPSTSTQPTAERVMSEEAAALSKLKGTNSQMADLLGKCIDVLEIELFEKREKMENKEDDTTNVDQYSPDEASLVSVLAGIKHVRDVLSGKQPSFDPSVIPVNTPTTPTTTSAPSQPTPTTPTTGTAVPTTPTAPAPAPAAPAAATTTGGVTDTASTDDQPSLKDWDVVSYQEDDKQSILSSQDPGTKPLPQLQPTQSQESHPESTPATLVNKTISESAPSSSTRRAAVPKENVVYSIEDLLSDPTLQKEKTSSSKSNKFNWMLDEQENDKGERSSHLFRPTSSPRKRASVNFGNYSKSPSSSSGSAVQTVDPLGAKSTD